MSSQLTLQKFVLPVVQDGAKENGVDATPCVACAFELADDLHHCFHGDRGGGVAVNHRDHFTVEPFAEQKTLPGNSERRILGPSRPKVGDHEIDALERSHTLEEPSKIFAFAAENRIEQGHRLIYSDRKSVV